MWIQISSWYLRQQLRCDWNGEFSSALGIMIIASFPNESSRHPRLYSQRSKISRIFHSSYVIISGSKIYTKEKRNSCGFRWLSIMAFSYVALGKGSNTIRRKKKMFKKKSMKESRGDWTFPAISRAVKFYSHPHSIFLSFKSFRTIFLSSSKIIHIINHN